MTGTEGAASSTGRRAAGRGATGRDATSSAGRRDLADQQFARSLRFWMRAYPRRWRNLRGGEVMDLVTDLAEPGARRLGARTAFDLLRGGWATRWREHPPLHTWLAYRVANRRIPEGYRAWALDDIDGFFFPIRLGLLGPTAVILVVNFANPSFRDGLPTWLWWAFAGSMVASLFLKPDGRRQARLKHLAPLPGERLADGELVTVEVPGVRLQARSLLPWAITILGVASALAIGATLLAPKMLVVAADPDAPRRGGVPGTQTLLVAPIGGRWVVAVAILLVALVVGLIAANVANRRLGRLIGDRPPQPNRVVRPLTGTGAANLVFWACALAVLTWCEITGRIVLGPSVLLGAGALVLLPGALVAFVLIRQTDDPTLTAGDLWCIAALGRIPSVDPAVPALRPFVGRPLTQKATAQDAATNIAGATYP